MGHFVSSGKRVNVLVAAKLSEPRERNIEHEAVPARPGLDENTEVK